MKDFTKRIQELRDEMHKEIIKEVILRTSNEDGDYDLELNRPFFTYAYEWDGDYQVKVAVLGITGDGHRLITKCITDGEVSENIDYQDLEFAELDYLYKQITTDSFTIKVY